MRELTQLQLDLLRRIENGELRFTPRTENMTHDEFQIVAQALLEIAENGSEILHNQYEESRKNKENKQNGVNRKAKRPIKLQESEFGKIMRISEAARFLNCPKESIRTGKIGGFKTFKLNDKPKSPLFVYEVDVSAYLEKLRLEKKTNSSPDSVFSRINFNK